MELAKQAATAAKADRLEANNCEVRAAAAKDGDAATARAEAEKLDEKAKEASRAAFAAEAAAQAAEDEAVAAADDAAGDAARERSLVEAAARSQALGSGRHPSAWRRRRRRRWPSR